MKSETKHTESPTNPTPSGDELDCPTVPGSAWRFRFSAEYPPERNRIGGTFLEGELECDAEDLPEAAVKILQNAFEDWDTDGQTHISFSIKPKQ